MNTGKPYEKLTQSVFDQILNQNSVKNIEVQQDVILQGKATSHQIDVYWCFELGGITHQVIIQAKDWKSKVKKVDMLAFKSVLDDLPSGTKGVFVSKSGFQIGAKEVAQMHGIQIYELREPIDSDWKGKIKEVIIEMHIRSPYYKNLAITLDKEWLMANGINIGTIPLGTRLHENYKLFDQQEHYIGTVSEVIKNLLSDSSHEESYLEKTFENVFLLQEETLLKIKSISGNFGFTVHKDTLRICIDNIVGLILVDILNGKMHRFDKNHKLIAQPNSD